MEFLANSLACRFVVASTARVSIKGRESWPGLKSHGSNVCTLYPTGGNLGHKPGFYATWIPPSLFMTALSLSLAPWELRFELQFSLSLWHRDSSRDSRNFSIDFQVSFGQRAFYELCKILPGDVVVYTYSNLSLLPSLYREISSILLLVKNCFAQLIEMYSVCHQAWCMWNVICLFVILNIELSIRTTNVLLNSG